MYSVLRLCNLTATDIQHVVDYCRQYCPAEVDGPDLRFADRISISLATDDEWNAHIQNVEAKLDTLAELAVSEHVVRILDLAIEPEDRNKWLSEWSFRVTFLKLLADRQISLNISIYERGE